MYETPLANRGFRCNDSTVPFPTAAISLVDPFENYDTSGIAVNEDDGHVVQSWHMPGQDEVMFAGGEARVVKRRPRFPPFLLLALPWPFKYVSHAFKVNLHQ